jgi:hypothetical protein
MPRQIDIDEATLRALWADKRLSRAQIAKRLGCSSGFVWKLEKRYNLPRRVFEKYDVDLMRRLWLNTTMTQQEIAFELGCSRQHVSYCVAEMGLPPRGKPANRNDPDPTPEEIAERAAQCRARHLREKKAEPFYQHEGNAGIRCFSYCGEYYSGASLLS